MPFYSLVEPNYSTSSEEDPQNIVDGEAFAASVIDAVMKSPVCQHTVLIWTYDEHGGYYDHVPPPAALAPDDIRPKVPAGQKKYNGSGSTASGCRSRCSRPGRARTTCRIRSWTTPASVRWWRPSGTSRR